MTMIATFSLLSTFNVGDSSTEVNEPQQQQTALILSITDALCEKHFLLLSECLQLLPQKAAILIVRLRQLWQARSTREALRQSVCNNREWFREEMGFYSASDKDSDRVVRTERAAELSLKASLQYRLAPIAQVVNHKFPNDADFASALVCCSLDI